MESDLKSLFPGKKLFIGTFFLKETIYLKRNGQASQEVDLVDLPTLQLNLRGRMKMPQSVNHHYNYVYLICFYGIIFCVNKRPQHPLEAVRKGQRSQLEGIEQAEEVLYKRGR